MLKSIVSLALFVALAPVMLSGTTRGGAAVSVHHAAAGAVTVTVDYQGKGTVDGSHRVWVWLFDTPEIGPGAMPIAEMSVAKNGATATFQVDRERVWIAVAYDEKGVMSGNSPPAPGSPIGIYSSSTGAPEAVATGAKGVAVVTFDDSIRMP